MNRYQKVLVCIFRSIGIFVLFYLLVLMVTYAITLPSMLSLFWKYMMPFGIPAIILTFAAIPLAKLVTIGISDDQK